MAVGHHVVWIDARLTLIALLPLPGVTIGTRYFGRAIHDRFERIQAQLSDMSAVVQEALAGVRVVRAYRQEPARVARFARANDEYVRRNQGLIRLQAAFYPTLTLCFGLSGLLVLWFGGQDVMTGRLTLGRIRRIRPVPRAVELAPHCVRLGHQSGAARHRVLGAHARGARRAGGR